MTAVVPGHRLGDNVIPLDAKRAGRLPGKAVHSQERENMKQLLDLLGALLHEIAQGVTVVGYMKEDKHTRDTFEAFGEFRRIWDAAKKNPEKFDYEQLRSRLLTESNRMHEAMNALIEKVERENDAFLCKCSEARREMLAFQMDSVKRMIVLFRALAEQNSFAPTKQTVELETLVELSRLTCERELGRGQLDFQAHDRDVDVHADVPLLLLAMLNLAKNASRAMNNRGTVVLRTNEDERHVHISVQDTGKGMTRDEIEQALKPGVTSKKDADNYGHGYGLLVCQLVVNSHNGVLSVHSVPGEGTTFTIKIPKQMTSGAWAAATGTDFAPLHA